MPRKKNNRITAVFAPAGLPAARLASVSAWRLRRDKSVSARQLRRDKSLACYAEAGGLGAYAKAYVTQMRSPGGGVCFFCLFYRGKIAKMLHVLAGVCAPAGRSRLLTYRISLILILR